MVISFPPVIITPRDKFSIISKSYENEVIIGKDKFYLIKYEKGLKNLSNLLLKRNRIGIKGLEDLYGLLELGKEFAVLDISDNLIDDPKIVDEILTKFIDLRVIL